MNTTKYGPVLLALAWATRPASAGDGLRTWRLEGGVVRADADTDDRPLPVGSLLKPFVAKAWALAHPAAEPPRLRCDAASACWRPSGHGTLGLTRALAVSCNTYFHALAADTPRETLEAMLRAEGFLPPSPLSPEAAIGLDADEGAVAIRPTALLEAYVRLTRTPWAAGEAVRRAVLAGLRDSALAGTAGGIGRRGFWAKTGTVPAIDGRPLRTSGWAVAVEDSGWAILGLLPEGTGRAAARALAEPLTRLRPGAGTHVTEPVVPLPGPWQDPAGRGPSPAEGTPSAPHGIVRVALFDPLRPRSIVARNAGPSPASSSRGYVGPGGSLSLRPGDRLLEALWELTLPGRHLLRRVKGALACEAGPGDTLRLRAEVTEQEYVGGVLAAELSGEENGRRVALGAAVLRFLADGPRHGTVDVCDSTHCAWFVGHGPRVLWPNPGHPVLRARREAGADEEALLDPAAWDRMRALSRQPGPRSWTGHCGGTPLSPHFLWGNGDRRVWACPRHRPGDASAWSRRWDDADLARAFGARVEALAVTERDGVWTLRTQTAAGVQDLRYDDAHRRLATVLGWAGLPSPASRIRPVPGGFRAEGIGLGHRVGLCLGD